MKVYGYAVKHIAAPEHCAGYLSLHATREEAERAKSLEYRYSRRYPSYVVCEITSCAWLRTIRDEIERGGPIRLPDW